MFGILWFVGRLLHRSQPRDARIPNWRSPPMLNMQSHTADWIVFPRNHHSTSTSTDARSCISQRASVDFSNVYLSAPPLSPLYSIYSLHICWCWPLGSPFILVLSRNSRWLWLYRSGQHAKIVDGPDNLVVSRSCRLIRSDIETTCIPNPTAAFMEAH